MNDSAERGNTSNSIVASIIVPVYNNGEFIRESLLSALAQSETRIEIVVCDDGSTDNTPSVIRRLSQTDDRIIVLQTDRNRGVSYSRNRAVAAASGKWVALLDGDDILHRDHVKDLCQFAEQLGADMVANGLVLIDQQGTETGQRFIPTKDAGQRLGLREFVKDGIPSSKRFTLGYLKPLIRRDFIVENRLVYDESACCGEDFMFYFLCLLHGADFRLNGNALYWYRKFPKPHSLDRKLNRIRQNRANNRTLMSAVCERPDILPLMRVRDRYFGYSERFELLREAVINRDLQGMIKESLGEPAYVLFVMRQISGRWLSRLHRKHRRMQIQR